MKRNKLTQVKTLSATAAVLLAYGLSVPAGIAAQTGGVDAQDEIGGSYQVPQLPVAGYTGYTTDTDRSSPKAFGKDTVKDTLITTKIKAKMAKDRDVSALHIKVNTDNKGMVTLSGTAKSQEEADKAVSIARGVEGVVSVENNIQIVAHR